MSTEVGGKHSLTLFAAAIYLLLGGATVAAYFLVPPDIRGSNRIFSFFLYIVLLIEFVVIFLVANHAQRRASEEDFSSTRLFVPLTIIGISAGFAVVVLILGLIFAETSDGEALVSILIILSLSLGLVVAVFWEKSESMFAAEEKVRTEAHQSSLNLLPLISEVMAAVRKQPRAPDTSVYIERAEKNLRALESRLANLGGYLSSEGDAQNVFQQLSDARDIFDRGENGVLPVQQLAEAAKLIERIMFGFGGRK